MLFAHIELFVKPLSVQQIALEALCFGVVHISVLMKALTILPSTTSSDCFMLLLQCVDAVGLMTGMAYSL